LARVSTLGF